MDHLPILPGLELLQHLGGGPLTQVFLARDCEADALCAVKLLRDGWADQPTAIKLLQREARAGLAVQHPHLVRIRSVHVLTPPYFLVMELLAGESLRSRLRRDYRLEPPTALWVARQVAEALAALHRAGFVHGDVKPDNIRLVDDGTAKLIDLGFAHRPGENAAFREQGYVLGTADYLAPELCTFETDAYTASDLFSLGVTLFEMLTGELPYPPGTLAETLRRHHADPPAGLRSFGADWPASLVELQERMLTRKPSARPRAGAVVRQFIELEIATLARRRTARAS